MKAQLFHVIKTGPESFLFQEDRLPSFYGFVHYHPEIQITLIVKGSGVRLIGDQVSPFGPGHLMMIGENLPHVFRNNPVEEGDHVEAISLYFNRRAFGDSFFDLPEMARVRTLLEKASGGLDVQGGTRTFVEEKLRRMRMLQGFDRFLGLLEILRAISVSDRLVEMEINRKGLYSNPQDAERLNRVFNYVFTHLGRPISLDEMADLTHFTPSGFCRYFKTKTRRSFIAFLNEVRIQRAKELLRERAWPVAKIAMESGYENLSHFNRQFRRITGTTPRLYRSSIQMG
jgi:AraC-like DNA-binding protein